MTDCSLVFFYMKLSIISERNEVCQIFDAVLERRERCYETTFRNVDGDGP
jgi:hypothetical protein